MRTVVRGTSDRNPSLEPLLPIGTKIRLLAGVHDGTRYRETKGVITNVQLTGERPYCCRLEFGKYSRWNAYWFDRADFEIES